MTSLLKKKATDETANNAFLVDRGGENLVLSLGNVLNSAAEKASVARETKEPQGAREEVHHVTCHNKLPRRTRRPPDCSRPVFA